MKLTKNEPPRTFTVGQQQSITLSDCGALVLDPDEQITFTTESGAEYDVARKAWGYYATPSLNGRLPRLGLLPALVVNTADQYYVLLVEPDKKHLFSEYLAEESLTLICWLHDTDILKQIQQSVHHD